MPRQQFAYRRVSFTSLRRGDDFDLPRSIVKFPCDLVARALGNHLDANRHRDLAVTEWRFTMSLASNKPGWPVSISVSRSTISFTSASDSTMSTTN